MAERTKAQIELIPVTEANVGDRLVVSDRILTVTYSEEWVDDVFVLELARHQLRRKIGDYVWRALPEADSIDATEEVAEGDGALCIAAALDEHDLPLTAQYVRDTAAALNAERERRERLEAAWHRSEEELDWIADIEDSGIRQQDAERIAKEVIDRFKAALAPLPDRGGG